MKGYIYCISCKDKKVHHNYIGSTNNISRRIKEHKKNSYFKNRKVYNCIRKFGGWNNWEVDLIDIDEYNNLEELRNKELKLINILDCDLNIIR